MGKWSCTQPAGEARPAPRGGHACVVIGNKVLVFGGADRTARPFGDIWLLDREGDVPDSYRWQPAGPVTFGPGVNLTPRVGATLTAVGSSVYLYGGQDPQTGTLIEDMLMLNTHTWKWFKAETDGPRPPVRHSHCAGPLLGTHLLVVGGAGRESLLGDLWTFDCAARAWHQPAASGPPPEPCEMASGTMLDAHRILLLGGRGPAGQVLRSAHIYDGRSFVWTALPIMPFPRCAHTAVAVTLSTLLQPGQQTGPFMGQMGSSVPDVNQMPGMQALLHGLGQGTGSSLPQLTPELQLQAILHPTGHPKILLYGGFSGSDVDASLYLLSLENMGARQLSPEPDSRPPTGMADVVPKPRFAHTAVLLQGVTPGSLDMVVIGGVNHHQDLDEVLTWHCDRADLQLFQDLNGPARLLG
ncbi:hypothetical protein WJX74_002328 [Apatococcus lobatus]|uniref:Uncharacterized protein n=2 Tax=Apatococcus TaxID=904362 RepID=A0AAW1SX16_9CHLO